MPRVQPRQPDSVTVPVHRGPREREEGLWSALWCHRLKPMEREQTQHETALSRYGKAAC